jgi:signal transduction histidine kinase
MHQDTSEQSVEALSFHELLRDFLTCGVLAVDLTQCICTANAEAERLLDLQASAILGKPAAALPSELQQLIDDTFTGEGANSHRTLQLTRGVEIDRFLQVSSTCWRDREGGVAGVIVLLNDAEAAGKLAASVQRLDRMASIGTLSASMAHEIKNALVSMTTFVDDLRARHQDSELVGLVGREFRRIDAIVSQMLKFAGPAKPTFAHVSVHRILDQSLRLIQPQLESKQIFLRRSFGARSDRVDGDEYQIEQAFINLLLNGVAALSPKGQLSVSTEQGPAASAGESSDTALEPAIEITIEDTGVGIAPENLPRLFEPFFTTKPQGTGLGLAITRRIVLEHRGKIVVESELGKGTTFHIALPLVK